MQVVYKVWLDYKCCGKLKETLDCRRVIWSACGLWQFSVFHWMIRADHLGKGSSELGTGRGERQTPRQLMWLWSHEGRKGIDYGRPEWFVIWATILGAVPRTDNQEHRAEVAPEEGGCQVSKWELMVTPSQVAAMQGMGCEQNLDIWTFLKFSKALCEIKWGVKGDVTVWAQCWWWS